MTSGLEWLIDKSALARIHSSPDAVEWTHRIERGLVRITTATLLEVGYSARSAKGWQGLLRQPPVSSMPIEHAVPRGEDRAVEVQGILARQGHHRAPSVADLLIAATAEVSNLVVLHVDKDFELIASVTGQTIERLRTE